MKEKHSLAVRQARMLLVKNGLSEDEADGLIDLLNSQTSPTDRDIALIAEKIQSSAPKSLPISRVKNIVNAVMLGVAGNATYEYSKPIFQALGNALGGVARANDAAVFRWPVEEEASVFTFRAERALFQRIRLCATKASDILCCGDGVVYNIGNHQNTGIVIVIQHTNGLISFHNDVPSCNVTRGQQLKRGDVVAHLGAGEDFSFDVQDQLKDSERTGFILPPRKKGTASVMDINGVDGLFTKFPGRIKYEN